MSNGTSHPKPKTRSSLHFTAGLATGILSASLLQPADLLKTRVQQSPESSLGATLRSISAGPRALQELWRGTLPSIIRTGFGSALYFTGLNALRRSSLFAAPPTGTIPAVGIAGGGGKGEGGAKVRYSNANNLLSGALARTMAGMALMPVTVLKVRYESSLYRYTSLWAAAGSIVRTEGVRGLFAGFGATAARDAPYAGLYVLFYEQARSRLGAVLGSGGGGSGVGGLDVGGVRQTPVVNFSSGVVAAVAATAITNPFDAVKTRLQLRPQEYGHMMRAAVRMVREEGVRSLFDGLGLRVARKALSSAIAWSLYEELVRVGEGRWIWKTEGKI